MRGSLRSAPGRPWLGLLRLDGFIGEPDRQAPALAEAGVVLPPVHHLPLLFEDMVAAVLVQLEGHAGHPGRQGDDSRADYVSACGVTLSGSGYPTRFSAQWFSSDGGWSEVASAGWVQPISTCQRHVTSSPT
jgi:hypothetical protein